MSCSTKLNGIKFIGSMYLILALFFVQYLLEGTTLLKITCFLMLAVIFASAVVVTKYMYYDSVCWKICFLICKYWTGPMWCLYGIDCIDLVIYNQELFMGMSATFIDPDKVLVAAGYFTVTNFAFLIYAYCQDHWIELFHNLGYQYTR